MIVPAPSVPTPYPDAEMGAMTSTSLTPGQHHGSGWMDLVAAFTSRAADVVLIALGEDAASEKLREILEQSFAEIDAVTGSHLMVLAPICPPTDWFLRKLDVLAQLPDGVQELQRDELERLRTPAGLQAARRATANILEDQWEGTAVPSLVFLAEALDAEDGASFIHGWSHDFAQFQTRPQVVAAMTFLGQLAAKRRAGACSVDKRLNEQAYSWTNPQSLRWRSAANRSTGLLDLALGWASRLRSAGVAPRSNK